MSAAWGGGMGGWGYGGMAVDAIRVGREDHSQMRGQSRELRLPFGFGVAALPRLLVGGERPLAGERCHLSARRAAILLHLRDPVLGYGVAVPKVNASLRRR